VRVDSGGPIRPKSKNFCCGLEAGTHRLDRILKSASVALLLALSWGLCSCTPSQVGDERAVSITVRALTTDLRSDPSLPEPAFPVISERKFGERALVQRAPGVLEWEVEVPASGPQLTFDLWTEFQGDLADTLVEAEVFVVEEDSGKRQALFSKILRTGSSWRNPRIRAVSPGRSSHTISLAEFAGERIKLEFSSAFVPGSKGDVEIIWGNPLLKEWTRTSLPNIVLICVDTLRQDRVGAYSSGDAAGLTPAIDALASDGVRFSDAVAQAPWTLPSVVSVMTGLPPSLHGAGKRLHVSKDPNVARDAESDLQRLGVETVTTERAGVSRVYSMLGSEILTLPEYLDDRYETLLVNSKNGWLTATKLPQRFQSSHFYAGDDDSAVRIGSEWLQVHEKDLSLIYYHLIYAHEWVHGFTPLSAGGTREEGRLAYDNSVRSADQAVGQIVNDLQERGLYDDSLIILWSDHGEHLWDEGWGDYLGHGERLSNLLLRVPLILKFPRSEFAGRVVEQPVPVMDIFGTVLEEGGKAGVVVNGAIPEQWKAASLRQMIEGSRPTFVPAEFAVWEGDFHSVQNDRYRLIWDKRTNRRELLDLASDSILSGPLDKHQAEDKRALSSVLDSYLQYVQSRERTETPLDPSDEEIELLKALGYLQEAAPKGGAPDAR
jgi:arylsulfatase A-like enzyme